MIRLKTVRWKNFLATGNRFLEVNLDQDPMMLVVGKNGAGKSTLIDAITFSLFGKPLYDIWVDDKAINDKTFFDVNNDSIENR